MFVKLSILLVFLFISLVAGNAQKKNDRIKTGIINGRAISLPKPVYPQEAKDFCAGGKVEVKVLVSEEGRIIEAEAISGDELLRAASVEAAKKAKFSPMMESPVKVEGLLVYNFPSEKKCIDGGIVNKKALSLPTPSINPDIKIKQETVVKVGVIIDETGKVIFAKVLTSIHPLLRVAFESSARQAKFYPTNDVGRIRVRGYIIYKIKLNGKVET